MAATLTPELYVSKQIPNHATLKPELYVSKQIPNNSTLTPELFVSKQIPNHSSLKPELFVSGKFQFNVKDDYDTEVEYKNTPAWRYENAGYKEQTLLYGTNKTLTSGVAFTQSSRKKLFPIPSTKELWVKFSAHLEGNIRIYDDASSQADGIRLYSGSSTSPIWAHDSNVSSPSLNNPTEATYILHMVSGANSGVIELWRDGTQVASYTGNVKGGNNFEMFYLQADSGSNYWWDITISNEEVTFDDTVEPNDKQWLMPSFSTTWSTSQDFCGKMSNNGKVAWLFDYDMNDKIAIYNGISVSLYMKTAVMVKHLYLYSGDATLLPTDMTLECSDDGETWTACGSLEPDTSGYRVIKGTAARPYNYYRLTGNDTTEKSLSNIHIDAVTGLEPASFAINADTKINIQNTSITNADTEITYKTATNTTINADTSVLIYQSPMDIEENFDTSVKIIDQIKDNYDTSIEIKQGGASNFDTEIRILGADVSNFDTEINIANDRFKVVVLNGDTSIETYKQITHTYGYVDCRRIDLGKVYNIEAAISIEGAGFARIRYSTGTNSGDFADYKPKQVKCRYIDVILVVRDVMTKARLQVIPVPQEITVNAHIPVNGKTVTFDSFVGKPMIFPSASQYNVRVKDITEDSCYVTLYDENNASVEGDVALLIKG